MPKTRQPDLADHIQRLIAKAPPLTPETRDRIAALIKAGA